MATVRKRTVNGAYYYYLEHSFRLGKKVEKKERYLGKTIPKDLERIKAEFLSQFYSKNWFSKFDTVRKGYADERRKMPPSALEKEIETFAVRFTYDTNRMEGSSLTLRETANLLERGIAPREKPVRDIKETEAHRDLFNEMLTYEKEADLNTLLYWHKKLLERTKPDVAGKIRNHQVAISGSRFLPPSPAEVPALMDDFFRWYAKSRQKLHPVELAALAHLKLVTIHPFADGNGRISRLMMNFVLKKHGFPMLNIRYEKRAGYYSALERSQVSRSSLAFLNWFFKRYLKEHASYLKTGK